MTVYCIRRRGDGNGLLKLGYTGNLEGRVRQYRQQHPEGIELVVSVPGDRDLEAVLLEHLSGSNSVGEWFEPTMEVLSMVETLERVAKRRRGHIGDIKSSDTAPSGDAPPIPSEDPTMEAIWNAAPDLSKIPDDIALDIQSLDWESRHRMAIELREWAASAAEWVMPELKMGRLE